MKTMTLFWKMMVEEMVLSFYLSLIGVFWSFVADYGVAVDVVYWVIDFEKQQ